MTDLRYPERVERLRDLMNNPPSPPPAPPPATEGAPAPAPPVAQQPVDALIVSHLENARYLSGFTGSSALIIVTGADLVFLTDGRYALQSAAEAVGFERVILPQGSSLAEGASEVIKKLGVRRVGFEAQHLSFSAYEALRKTMPENVTLIPRSDAVEAVRQIKDAGEIGAMRRAIAVADACFDFIRETARVGMTEKALGWEIEMFMRGRMGAQRLSFDSIVGSGPNSALIHGRPSDRVIGSSGGPEFLLCDYGCEVDGYCSDITRTFVIGGAPTGRHVTMYEAVKQAQQTALDAIRPGMVGKDVDKAARDVLTAKGFGEAFAHSLGHGLGRVVHDGQAFSRISEIVLAPGMVVTVEPGAYIEGFGGVRIEDDVVVTETGCDILTHSTKEMLVL